jgi:two-component system NarL family response regulator
MAMLEAGAQGYVLKGAPSEELVRAIQAVHQGQKYLSAGVTAAVVEKSIEGSGEQKATAVMILGKREREVLQLLAEGRRSKDIAERLGVTVSTIEAHRRNIMRKLGLHSVADLTKYAIREGLTHLE